MKQAAFFFILTISLFGCQNVKQPEKPKDLISKDKMVEILSEAYLANAARSVNNQAILDKSIKMDSLIYKNFGVDSLQFANSNAYYAANVNSYLEIFQKVETKLTAMQQKMDSIRDIQSTKKDSIGNQKIKDITDEEPTRDSLI
jgi:hypothetical protein